MFTAAFSGIEFAVALYLFCELTKKRRNGELCVIRTSKAARDRVRKIVALCSFAIVYEAHFMTAMLLSVSVYLYNKSFGWLYAYELLRQNITT